jgi:hypothetical protein
MMSVGNSPVGVDLHKRFRPLAGAGVAHGGRDNKRAGYKLSGMS